MLVLQILQLRLPSLSSLSRSPSSSSTLLQNLATFILHQNPSSKIFQVIPAEDPTLLYILSPWPSTSHPDFLASPGIESIFSGPAKNGVEFVRSFHIALPSTVPTVSASEPITINSVSDIPVLKAPTLMVAGLYVTSTEIENITNEDRPALLKACDRYGVVDGWRIDAEEGKLEYIDINGWESVEAHREFFALMVAEEGYRKRWEGCVKGSEVRHMTVLDLR
jgi:hypothetical protein